MAEANSGQSQAIAKAASAVSSSSGGNTGAVLFLLIALFLIYLNRIGALPKIIQAIRNPAPGTDTGMGKPFGEAQGTEPDGKILGTPTPQYGLPGNKPPLSGAITPKGSLGKK